MSLEGFICCILKQNYKNSKKMKIMYLVLSNNGELVSIFDSKEAAVDECIRLNSEEANCFNINCLINFFKSIIF